MNKTIFDANAEFVCEFVKNNFARIRQYDVASTCYYPDAVTCFADAVKIRDFEISQFTFDDFIFYLNHKREFLVRLCVVWYLADIAGLFIKDFCKNFDEVFHV